MKLSKNFYLEEFIKSETASRYNIDNNPPKDAIARIQALAVNILQPTRDYFGKPIIITSGYRSPKLNKAIRGSRNSQHMNGEAADFHVLSISNLDLAQWLKSNLNFDQLILEFMINDNPFSGWVHCSYRANINRKQCLIIDRKGTRFA